jgi:methionyl aminopeptidase
MVYMRGMTQYQTITADDPVTRTGAIKLYGPEGFEGMRRAGRLAAEILDALGPHIVPGVTTEEIDRIVYDMTIAGGAVPATLGYRGYTHSCCISINHVVCHGIPERQDDARRRYRQCRCHAACSTAGMATPTAPIWRRCALKAKKLVEVTYECLMLGIERPSPALDWATSAMRSSTHAEQAIRYGVVRDFCGHGVGPPVP